MDKCGGKTCYTESIDKHLPKMRYIEKSVNQGSHFSREFLCNIDLIHGGGIQNPMWKYRFVGRKRRYPNGHGIVEHCNSTKPTG